MLYTDIQSSFIKTIGYDDAKKHLCILFQNGNEYTYENVSYNLYEHLMKAESIGRFYQQNIKGKFSIFKPNINQNQMKSDKLISVKIDVNKIKKEWLFKGEKGIYLDLVIFYNEEPTVSTFDGKEYSSNGMIVQSVPKAVYDKNKDEKGPILGNVKDLSKGTGAAGESMADASKANQVNSAKDLPDDLPF